MSAHAETYRRRLLPLIDMWSRRHTRVAIFGTGPHTDLLFDHVPELRLVRIVGYVGSRVTQPAARYRGRPVHPLEWAAEHADVILCSSFVNESSMAALVDSLPCKVVTSHTERDAASAAPPRSPVTFRPSATGRRIAWPAVGVGVIPARYLEDTRVLDAIIEAHYPFVDPTEADLARTVVRLITPGMSVVELDARSPRVTALASLCAWPAGQVVSVGADFDARAVRPLVGPAGLRVARAESATLFRSGSFADNTVVLTSSAARSQVVESIVGRASDAGLDACVIHLRQGQAHSVAVARRLMTAAPGLVLIAVDTGTPLESVAALQQSTDAAGYAWHQIGAATQPPDGGRVGPSVVFVALAPAAAPHLAARSLRLLAPHARHPLRARRALTRTA